MSALVSAPRRENTERRERTFRGLGRPPRPLPESCSRGAAHQAHPEAGRPPEAGPPTPRRGRPPRALTRGGSPPRLGATDLLPPAEGAPARSRASSRRDQKASLYHRQDREALGFGDDMRCKRGGQCAPRRASPQYLSCACGTRVSRS